MNTSVTPDSLERYFQCFAAYLKSGEMSHLFTVFPGTDELSAAAVYRNGFLRSCTEALRKSYPVVDTLVGNEYFDHLADIYISLHPPQNSTLVDYGKRFPEFLEQHLPLHNLAYLSDFARLDRAWLHAYFAADSALLGEDDIEHWQQAGNTIEQLAARLPESAQLLTLGQEVSTAWLTLKAGETLAKNTRIEARDEPLLLWRDAQQRVRVRVLIPAEMAFLKPLCKCATLAQAAMSAISLDDRFKVVDFFSELLETDVLAVNL